jgi:hypothetical protein
VSTFKLTLPVLALCALTACAGKPTLGDAMRDHAAQQQASVDLQNKLAKDWERGSKLKKAGDKRVKAAQKELERGQKEIAEGDQLMEQSEAQVRTSFPTLTFDHN